MEIMFIGDIVGKPGREVIKTLLPSLIEEYLIDFVIANGENATHGKGLSKEHMLELLNSGVDVITLGNHAFAKKDTFEYINDYDEVIRPYNLHKCFPGKGTNVFDLYNKKIRVTNLLGRVYLSMNVSNPFDDLEQIIKEDKSDIHIVDFHAEATGEKMALAKAFDGKITALLGTHTHVATMDTKILDNGTAYQSDVGMVGPYDGILGCECKGVIERTWKGLPATFDVEESGKKVFNATIISIDDKTNKVINIEPIQRILAAK